MDDLALGRVHDHDDGAALRLDGADGDDQGDDRFARLGIGVGDHDIRALAGGSVA